MENKELEKFIEKFKLEEHGFYHIVSVEERIIGFVAYKKLTLNNKYDSFIEVCYKDYSKSKKILSITIIYGEANSKNKEKGEIQLNFNRSSKDPVNLYSENVKNKYYYDIKDNKFYKNNNEINPEEIIKEIYEKHISPKYFLKGFFVRMKIFFNKIFYNIFLRLVFKYISKMFYYLLIIISGDKYTYNPFMEETTDNR